MRVVLILLTWLLLAVPVAAQGPGGPWTKITFGSDSGPTISSGTGSPEGVVTAGGGSLYLQTDGASGFTLWTKVGTGNTGWEAPTGGGGGSHNLLSATHSDTAANAPVRGAVPVANSTPAWARLTPTTTGQVLRFNGTDTAWSLDGSLFEDLNGTEITSGTVANARLTSDVSLFGSAVDNSEITAATITFAKWASNSCSSNQIPKWNGAAWACATDEISGTVYAPADASYVTVSSESGLSNETVIGSASISWADGVKQTFNPNGTNAGVNVGSHAGDPGSPANGDLWYDSGTNELTARINGSNVALGAGGSSPGGSSGDLQINDGAGGFDSYAGDGCSPGDFVTDIDTDGSVTCDTPSGSGGGEWSLRFTALSNMPPASNPATFATRNATPVLEFDTTTQEGAMFLSVLPHDYGGGGVTVCAHWAAATATSGTIGWDVAFERIGDSQQDLDADGFGTAATITATTVPGTSGHVDITCVNISNGSDMDSLAAGESFRLRIRRDVSNDNAAGDAQLVAVDIREQ